MNYEEFKNVVKEEFKNYLPEEYRHLEMNVISVDKVNRVKDGMTFLNNDKESWVSPTIYLEDMYESYQESQDYQKVFEDVAEVVTKVLKEPPVNEKLDAMDAKDSIVFQLINTEQNKGLLSSLPHREFHDLSIIYRWVVSLDKSGMQSVVIRKDLMDQLGLNEEQMFKMAVENYKRLLSPNIRTLDEIIIESMVREGMSKEIAVLMLTNHSEDETLWIISNDAKINGAASMLYDDMLQEVAKKLDSDLYVIPSSVHETIAISVNMGEPYELAKMVNEINMNAVILEDRLSNQVYHYDRKLHKLTMATNTPLKRLDGFVAEPQLIYSTKNRVR